MRKVLLILAIVLAVTISIGAASADDSWNFDFSSSSDSDGGQLDVNNNNVKIQGFEFVMPDGYTHNASSDKIGEDAGKNFPGCKMSLVEFNKGDDSIVIKVVYGDTKFDNDTYEPVQGSVEKTIGGQKGHFEDNDEGLSFAYTKDGKLVDIFANDEQALNSVLQSAK